MRINREIGRSGLIVAMLFTAIAYAWNQPSLLYRIRLLAAGAGEDFIVNCEPDDHGEYVYWFRRESRAPEAILATVKNELFASPGRFRSVQFVLESKTSSETSDHLASALQQIADRGGMLFVSVQVYGSRDSIVFIQKPAASKRRYQHVPCTPITRSDLSEHEGKGFQPAMAQQLNFIKFAKDDFTEFFGPPLSVRRDQFINPLNPKFETALQGNNIDEQWIYEWTKPNRRMIISFEKGAPTLCAEQFESWWGPPRVHDQ